MRRSRRTAWAVAVCVVLGLVAGAVGCGGPKVKRALIPEHCTARNDTGEVSLDIEQAQVASTIIAVAIRRGLPQRAVVIALATAEQESKMHNLDYGDRDSVGVFQQRPSQGWGDAADLQDPTYATNRFYSALVKVRNYQELPIHVAAQKVQRSAYGPAYAEHEDKAKVISTAMTGRSGSDGFTCVLRPTGKGTKAANVRELVRHDWGPRDVAAAGGGFTVRMSSTAPPRHTLAMSFWLVARAKDLGIGSVQGSGKQWRAFDDDEVWHETEKADRTGVISVRLLPRPTATPS